MIEDLRNQRDSEGTKILETTKSATVSGTERIQGGDSYHQHKEGFKITPPAGITWQQFGYQKRTYIARVNWFISLISLQLQLHPATTKLIWSWFCHFQFSTSLS